VRRGLSGVLVIAGGDAAPVGAQQRISLTPLSSPTTPPGVASLRSVTAADIPRRGSRRRPIALANCLVDGIERSGEPIIVLTDATIRRCDMDRVAGNQFSAPCGLANSPVAPGTRFLWRRQGSLDQSSVFVDCAEVSHVSMKSTTRPASSRTLWAPTYKSGRIRTTRASSESIA
jgi:hypothetical protein